MCTSRVGLLFSPLLPRPPPPPSVLGDFTSDAPLGDLLSVVPSRSFSLSRLVIIGDLDLSLLLLLRLTATPASSLSGVVSRPALLLACFSATAGAAFFGVVLASSSSLSALLSSLPSASSLLASSLARGGVLPIAVDAASLGARLSALRRRTRFFPALPLSIARVPPGSSAVGTGGSYARYHTLRRAHRRVNIGTATMRSCALTQNTTAASPSARNNNKIPLHSPAERINFVLLVANAANQ
jgi:hypothetical protein